MSQLRTPTVITTLVTVATLVAPAVASAGVQVNHNEVLADAAPGRIALHHNEVLAASPVR